MVSLARGHDPRDYVLFPFGGAGPLHAAALARELAIPKLLIPVRPGITNALGCVVADARHDYVNTVNKPLPVLDIDLVWATLEAQIAEGLATLAREGVAIEGTRILHFADMQFQGQSHILTLTLPQLKVAKDELQRLFEAAYWERFGVELPEIRAVLVNLHTAVIGLRPRLDLSVLARAGRATDLKGALNGTRAVWFEGGFRDTPIYQREKLPLDANFAGPAVIEQLDCTTVIDPGNRVELDALGNLLVTV
jgi:N-methylhydantoinase A